MIMIGKFLRSILGNKENNKKQDIIYNSSGCINNEKTKGQYTEKVEFSIRTKLNNLKCICPNCDHDAYINGQVNYDLKCPACGLEGRVDLKDGKFDFFPYKNPHPLKIFFGDKKIDLIDMDLLDDLHCKDEVNREIINLLERCKEQEFNQYSTGWSVTPNTYYRLAVCARKIKNYKLEIATCERFLILVEEQDKACDILDPLGARIRYSSKVSEMRYRLSRAQELLEKNNNTDQKESHAPKKASNTYIIGPFTSLCLKKQCEFLDIPLNQIALKWDENTKKYDFDKTIQIKKVEEAVMYTLRKQGFQGTFYELHPLMQIMQAGCLPYLEESSKNLFEENYRARTFSAQIGMYGLDKEKLANLINTCSRDILLEKWKEIYADSTVQKWFPGITVEDINALITAIPQKTFSQILDAVLKDPINNSVGWPDIFAYDGEKLRLIEVKTTDKLRESQKYTYINIIKKIGLPVEVIQVIKK